MTSPESDIIRERLNAELAELRMTSTSSAESRKAVSLDQQSVGRLSRMDAMQQQNMAMASEKRRQQRIQRIEGAINRLDDGDYGWCVTCGEDIEPRRLEADPTSPTCTGCAPA
ncbi:MAG: TraR/DksA family transcriptional regulator [Proteobacteria bacterium]|nr:TraR/DksA family transcriptional regulator [Pseudomonadota bacterium]